VFLRFPDFLQDSSLSDAQLRQLLAKGIPALSGPAGSRAVALGADPRNFDMNNPDHVGRPHGWGRNTSTYGTRWLHGDLKAMAFFYNYPIFLGITDKGSTIPQ